MKARLPLLVMLGGSLTFLASLYLTWVTVARPTCHGLFCDLNAPLFTGWSSGVGDAAALMALALAAAAIACMIRPSLADLLSLGAAALMLVYLAVAADALVWHAASSYAHEENGKLVWAFGGYLAFAAAVVTALSAWVFRDVAMPRTAPDVLAWIIGLGLLVAFLLPWHRVSFGDIHARETYTLLGVSSPTELAAGLVLLGLSRERLQSLCWAGAALFTLGRFGFGGTGDFESNRAYGLWLGLGFALAVLAFAAFSARTEWRSLVRPRRRDAFIVAAAAVYVLSLYLPWQRLCDGDHGCYTATGWSLPASSAALLAGIAAVLVLLRSGEHWLPELAAGVGLLVVVAGMDLPFHAPFGAHYAYGAILSFCAAGLFVALGMARFRLRLKLVTARLVPIATAVLLILAISVPWWNVLPSSWQATALTGWLAVAGLLLTLHVLFSWEQPSLVVLALPLGVLTLVVVQAILERDIEPTWGTGVVSALCLLLAAFGWAELRGGLGNFRIPEEIWRVDRISAVED